jgi:DNA-binding Xre family transcriptional regulator
MNSVLENFKRYFPLIAADVVDVVNRTDTFVEVEVQNGIRLIYDDIDNTIRTLPIDSSGMSEDECRREFGIRLRRLMYIKGITEDELSERTGITQPRLSGYIRGQNSPSFYKVDKIAKALDCSVDEFRYV